MRCTLLMLCLVLIGCKSESTTTKQQQDFIDLVKANAEDPTGLEIIEWGDEKKDDTGRWRTVKFRCAKATVLGHKVIEAEVRYGDDGAIRHANIYETKSVWKPISR